MGPGTVLVLAASDDGEAEYVADGLAARGCESVRLDTSGFPEVVTVSAELTAGGWQSEIASAGRLIQLADLSAMFYRQPRLFSFPVHLTDSERRFATVEARFGVGGLLASLPVRREVGHKSGFVVHLD